MAPVAAKLRRAAPPWGKAFASDGRSAWRFVWERPKPSNSNCRAYVSFQGMLESRRIKLVCQFGTVKKHRNVIWHHFLCWNWQEYNQGDLRLENIYLLHPSTTILIHFPNSCLGQQKLSGTWMTYRGNATVEITTSRIIDYFDGGIFLIFGHVWSPSMPITVNPMKLGTSQVKSILYDSSFFICTIVNQSI